MFARQFIIIILSIIAFFGESVKFILKLGELPVGELEFIPFVGELLSGQKADLDGEFLTAIA